MASSNRLHTEINEENLGLEQVFDAGKKLYLVIIGSLTVACLMVLLMWNYVPQRLILIWIMLFIVSLLIKTTLVLNYKKVKTETLGQYKVYFIFASIFSGTLWGVGFILMYSHLPMGEHIGLVAFIIGGLSAAAIITNSTIAWNYPAFLVSMISPIIIHFLSMGTVLYLFKAIMLGIFMVVVLIASSAYRKLYFEKTYTLNKLQGITASAQDAILMMDEEGKITYWNEASEKLFGYSKDEVIGKVLHSMLAPERFLVSVYEGFEHFKKTGEGPLVNNTVELTALKKGGIEFPIEVSISAIKKNDNWNAIGIIRDISERKEMELKLKQNEELMISQSRQAAMGDMIAMIAHQWRQPITVVAMAANNIKADIQLGEPISNEQLDKMSDDILNQTQHLSRTIDDFRNFFRPNQERTKTTLRKVLDDTMDIVGKSLQNNNIEVAINGECTQEIETFPNELLQVLLNLFNNAKDAVKGSKTEEEKIDITIKENDTEATLTLCDNGGGIPEEILSRLGEPYVSSKVESGTGLGIYMSKIIVEKHLLGTLTWENREEGACFRVTLPLKKA